MLRYSIVEKSSNRWNAYECGSYALDSVTEYDWIPDGIRRRATELLATAERVESPAWVAMVYGYFRNMWAPSGTMWSTTTDLVSARAGQMPDGFALDWHAGAVFVRKYFPDHVTRSDLIADPGKGYGSYPCTKCGERVQYEARWDRLVVYPAGLVCSADQGDHWRED